MSLVNFSPVFTVEAILADVIVEQKNDPKDLAEPRMILSLAMDSILGKGSLSAEQVHVLGQYVQIKVSQDVFNTMKHLVIGKKGERFEFKLVPEAYNVGGKTGVWYRFHGIEPI